MPLQVTFAHVKGNIGLIQGQTRGSFVQNGVIIHLFRLGRKILSVSPDRVRVIGLVHFLFSVDIHAPVIMSDGWSEVIWLQVPLGLRNLGDSVLL